MWQRAVILIAGILTALVIVLGLQWGRPILIPIALALLLTFLLNPMVRALQNRGLGRIFSVGVAVTVAAIVMAGLGGMVTMQVAGMLAELPQNTANIRAKVKTLRQLSSGPMVQRFGQMVDEISHDLEDPAPGKESTEATEKKTDLSPAPAEKSQVRTESSSWFNVSEYVGSVMEVLTTLAFTLVLLVFFLLGRDDLRDRIVLLAGKARLALTSKALEDVTNRISRYIVMVAIVNGGFGVFLTAGLFAFQVPYALLWGFLAAALRFIPYIGPWIGAIFPIVMSLATSTGWWQPLAVFSYVMLLELISNNVIEPIMFRHSTGVSPTALIISAAFWLYLWGPVGLVLSAPFAVCLVVLGKNIPQLGFLNLLLGDVPALRAHVGLYQRLMLGDQQDAATLILQRIKKSSSDEVYDDLLIPALNCTKQDVQRDYLTEDDLETVLAGMRSILGRTAELRDAKAGDKEQSSGANDAPDVNSAPSLSPAKILCCPAMDELDFVGIEMLEQLLDPTHWDVEIAAVETLTSELAKRLANDPPAIVCIAALPPSGMAHARYLCKRLREAAPQIHIVVGRWGQNRNIKMERERLEQAGASSMTTTLLETRKLLESRLPLIKRDTLPTPPTGAPPVLV
jgi:predicted PurR-regulated permease PerM